MSIAIGLAALVGIWVFLAGMTRAGRRRRLIEKYGDPRIADLIMKKMIWEGMSYDQLIDSRLAFERRRS